MVMCHMLADTDEELLDMANKIGLNPKWIQYPGTEKVHFDVSLGTRKKAIDNGAIEITRKETAMIIRSKRQKLKEAINE